MKSIAQFGARNGAAAAPIHFLQREYMAQHLAKSLVNYSTDGIVLRQDFLACRNTLILLDICNTPR